MDKNRGKIRQLRRRTGGLQDLIRRYGGTSPQTFYQDEINRNKDGTPAGPYNIGQIIDTRQHICPMWDLFKNQWTWAGTVQELAQLIEKSALKYESGPKKGTYIYQDKDTTPEQRLRDKDDAFFKHTALYNKLFLKDDRVSFDQDNPIHEILWKCQLGRTGVHDKSSGKRISKFDRNRVKLEAVAPSQEAKERKDKVKSLVKANYNLEKLEQNPQKMRAIAQALLLPTYTEESTPDEVYSAIYSEVIEGEQNPKSKYNGRTITARFNELCDEDGSNVSIIANVYLALRKQIIVRRGDDYLLNGELIKKVGGIYNLAKYFLEAKNQSQYLEVHDALGEDAF